MAALVVFIYHCQLVWYHEGSSRSGQEAVIVFFVLSGYVIAFSTLSKHRDTKNYTIARLARLYSVVAPALVLTLLIHLAVARFHLQSYHVDPRSNSLIRYVLAALFLQETWKLSASPPTNAPFWSLGYEFWYYALFGAAVLLPTRRVKVIVVLVIVLIAGLKILLLMPIWLFGVAAFSYRQKSELNPMLAQTGFLVSVFALMWAFKSLPPYPSSAGLAPLYYSSSFLSDWIVGGIVALLIWLFDQAFAHKSVPYLLSNSLRWGANHTFSLYLYHFPLIVLALAVLPINFHNPINAAVLLSVILALVLALSTFTEAKRSLWYNIFSTAWDKLSGLSRQSDLHLDNITTPDKTEAVKDGPKI